MITNFEELNDLLFIQETLASESKSLDITDFTSELQENYNFDVVDSTLKIADINASSNATSVVACKLLAPQFSQTTFKIVGNRVFLILGYNSSTEVCAVILRNTTQSAMGRIVNLNLIDNSVTTIVNDTQPSILSTDAVKVIFDAENVFLYVNDVLVKTINYADVLASGGFVTNKRIGFCAYDVTTTYANNSAVVKEVVLYGGTYVVEHERYATKQELSDLLATISQNPQSANLIGKKIAFLGDSISTIGAGGEQVNEHYINILKNKFQLETFVNAVSGSPIAIKGTQDSFVKPERYQTLNDNLIPDTIVIFGGTNDFGSDNVMLGTISDTIDTTFYGALKILLTQVQLENPYSKVIYISPLQRYMSSGEMKNTITNQYLHQFVNAGREICEMLGIYFVDAFTKSGINFYNANPVETDSTTLDGLHPNAKGHKMLADLLEKELISIFS